MKTKTAVLNGKPDAGNPHVRFDEGEVASAKPRRGSLLYMNRVVRAVFAAAVVAGCGSAWADVPASAYVQDGLVAQFDGIENAKDASGKVVHSDADGTKWLDLVSGEPVNLHASAESTPTIGVDHYAFAGKGDCFAATLNGFTDQIAVTGGFTVEVASEYSSLSKLGIGARIGDEGLYYQGSCLTYTVLTGQCGNWQSIKANTFNSAAVTYTSDAAAAGVKSYLNGALSAGNTTVTWKSAYNPGNDLKVGNHSASHAAVGKIYSARFYNRILSASEVAINAVIDRARFKGTWDDGYRWNAKTGKVEVRTRVKAIGSGKVAVGNENAASFFELWTVSGTKLRIAVTPDEGVPFQGWQGGEPAATETPGVYSYTVGTAAELKAVMGGAERAWVGGTDNLWSTEANWDPVGLPQAGERVSIPASKSVIVTEDMPKLATFDLAGTLTCSNWFTAVRADTVTVANGGKLTCGDPFSSNESSNRVWIVCRDLTVESGASVNVDDRGYKTSNGPGRPTASGNGKSNGGASYGGHGGTTWWYTSGVFPVIYGSAENPLDPGSGGSNAGTTLTTTSRGGGAVLVEATGTVTVNGTITACATYSTYNSSRGMGAGGGICIRSRRFRGSGGTIKANGAYGQPNWSGGEADTSQSLPGGGGRISIKYDPAMEQDGDFANMKITAAAGAFYAKYNNGMTSYYRTCTTADKYWTDADIGTLWFSDNRPVTGGEGTTLAGQLVYTNRFDFATFEVANGHWRFAAEGTVVNVAGDMKVSGANTRIEFGGSETLTNRLVTADIRAYTPWTLNVGGDLIVSGGARVDARSAQTNGTDAAGCYVNVAGDMRILGNESAYVSVDGLTMKSDRSSVYAFSDRINGGAPLFTVGSLTVESNAVFTASRLGFASGSQNVTLEDRKIVTGLGPGGGMCDSSGGTYAGAGHGGRGSCTNNSQLVNSGKVYDDELRPTLAGSGGGGRFAASGRCFGGGVIRVKAAGAIVVDGTVSADGETDAKTFVGAGSGGSILLDCRTFGGAASGLLSACGGNGMGLSSGRVAGGAGGGRIAVWTGRPWEEGVRAKHCTISEVPIRSDKDGSVYLGQAVVDGGVDAYRPTTTTTWGLPGTVRFVDYLGKPGLKLFVR